MLEFKIWEDQAQLMETTSSTLKGWFRSLHDTHARLDKKKSGYSAPNLTEGGVDHVKVRLPEDGHSQST